MLKFAADAGVSYLAQLLAIPKDHRGARIGKSLLRFRVRSLTRRSGPCITHSTILWIPLRAAPSQPSPSIIQPQAIERPRLEPMETAAQNVLRSRLPVNRSLVAAIFPLACAKANIKYVDGARILDTDNK